MFEHDEKYYAKKRRALKKKINPLEREKRTGVLSLRKWRKLHRLNAKYIKISEQWWKKLNENPPPTLIASGYDLTGKDQDKRFLADFPNPHDYKEDKYPIPHDSSVPVTEDTSKKVDIEYDAELERYFETVDGERVSGFGTSKEKFEDEYGWKKPEATTEHTNDR